MEDWREFMWPADEWLITYASPIHLLHVHPFCMFHCVELHLKAVFTKQTGNMDTARDMGHSLEKLLSICKTQDPTFLPEYEIRQNILAKMRNPKGFNFESMSPDDREHYLQNNELYHLSHLGPFLKYLAGPYDPKIGKPFWTFTHPNTYWITLIKRVRLYLQYPIPDEYDPIQDYLSKAEVPPQTANYLRQLFK